MRPFFLAICLAMVAKSATSETVTLDSRVEAVTLYPDMAEVTRSAQVDLPAGRHTLHLPGLAGDIIEINPKATLPGAEVLSLSFATDPGGPLLWQDAAVENAQKQIDSLRAEIRAVRQSAAEARLQATGAETVNRFLGGLGASLALDDATADSIDDLAAAIADQSQGAGTRAVAAEGRAQQIEEAIMPLERALEAAILRRDALRPPEGALGYAAILSIKADAPVSANLTLTYMVSVDAAWRPAYAFYFDTASDTLQIDRLAVIWQETGETWTDVEMTLTSLSGDGQVYASEPSKKLRRVEPRTPPEPAEDAAQEYLIEPEIIIEDRSESLLDGIQVEQRLENRITLRSGEGGIIVPLSTLQTQVVAEAQAVPSRESTAFRMALLRNDFGVNLLPSYDVPYYVDGQLIGVSDFKGLAPGAEDFIGFGPIEGLRLQRISRTTRNGDRGGTLRVNEHIEEIEITVDNQTPDDWTVRVLEAVPISDQDDLQIAWSAQPAPSLEEWQDIPGVIAWDLEVPASERSQISITSTMTWPLDMILQ